MPSEFQADFKNSKLPIGESIENWHPAARPTAKPIVGDYCKLERLTNTHAPDLYASYVEYNTPNDWVYLPYGPFESQPHFQKWIEEQAELEDPFFYAILDIKSDAVLGIASYLRIDPDIGSIEVGHIHFSPALQRSPAATEAMYLMMKQAFDAGYRRYEWKCDALNERSRRAALRLGFQFEGVFRQATMYKGRNRDTAWFSVIDKEWPTVEKGFKRWLSKSNFNVQGLQQSSLADCRNR